MSSDAKVPDEVRRKIDFCLPAAGEAPSYAVRQMESVAKALSDRPKSLGPGWDEEEDPAGIIIVG